MNASIQTHFAPDEIKYTGEQLRSLWAYRTFGLLGDSIVAFIGSCDVQPTHMKDMEDIRDASAIYSERMLHFIVEHFDADLDRAVLRQRLLMALMAECLNRRPGEPRIRRVGDDLYDGDRKATVSIASASPVSALIHAGINISSKNTPVPTVGLDDLDMDAHEFAAEISSAYKAEWMPTLLTSLRCHPLNRQAHRKTSFAKPLPIRLAPPRFRRSPGVAVPRALLFPTSRGLCRTC